MSHRKYGLDHWGYRSARRLVTPALTLWLCSQLFAVRVDLYFNPRFSVDNPAAVADLSGFERGQEASLGTYCIGIYPDNGFMTTRDVTFQADAQGYGLPPCLTRDQLASAGVDTGRVSGMAMLDSAACTPLMTPISEAITRFDVGQQRLYLTVPQAFMGTRTRGYIPPELWDNGITAGSINYSFTGNNVHNTTGGSSRYAYPNLQSGLNVGAWRLRDNNTWSYSNGSDSASSSENRWQHVNSWPERGITPLRSRLTLGDSYTNGDVFDRTNFRGIQPASDDNIPLGSQKDFAPVIHGTAHDTVQVSIRQNGYEIHQSTVSSGPFTVDDLYAVGNGGDPQVTIKEANGSCQVFSVPWSVVPAPQRGGHTCFVLTAGEYRSGSSQQETPDFFQSTVMHGLPAGWTLYGGTQLVDRYRTFNLRVRKNMGYPGVLSLDIAQANATLADDSEHQGQSVRFLHNKSPSETGTNLQLVDYRYSTHGYYNFVDITYRRVSGYSVETQDGVIRVKPKFAGYHNLAYSKRGRAQLSVTQQLGRTATFYLSGSHQIYRGTDDIDEQLQAGLNAVVDDINWSLSYSLTKNAWQQGRDQMLAVNVNIPFSHWLRSDSRSVWRHANASYGLSHDPNGRMINLAGLYGTLLEDNNLGYSVQVGYVGGGNGDSGGIGYTVLNYCGGYGNANVGYSRSDGFEQLYYGVSGGVLVYADGTALSQLLNDTVVLVKTPDTGGTKVENQIGVRADWHGYVVLPYAAEYRENRIALDTNTLADSVDFDDAVVSMVPTHGVIVRANFNAQVGMKILMMLTHHGKPVPFDALATGDSNQSDSIVANNSQVYLSGTPLVDKVRMKWGDGPDAQCVADYRLPPENQQQALSQLSAAHC